MKKKEYEYDYMFDWVLKKSKLKDVAYQDEESEEDYKKILKEALEGKKKQKEIDDKDDDEKSDSENN